MNYEGSKVGKGIPEAETPQANLPVMQDSLQATHRPSRTPMGGALLPPSFVLTESQGENLFPHSLFLAVSLEEEKNFLSNSPTR